MDLPRLPPLAMAGLIGLLLAFWLGMRVHILRRRQGLRHPDEGTVEAPGYLQRLAAWRWTQAAVLIVGAGCLALLVLSL